MTDSHEFQTTPSKQHYCLDSSYQSGKILCACVRGKDHNLAEMNVPADHEVQTLGGSPLPQAPQIDDTPRTEYNKAPEPTDTVPEAAPDEVGLNPQTDPDLVAAGERAEQNGNDPEKWAQSFKDNFEFDVPANETMIQFFKEAMAAAYQNGHSVGYQRGKSRGA